MQYPQFQAQGWPIGSGIVESGNKLVVETRLKGSGMHWAEENVNPMLAVRNVLCSGRWREDWPKIKKLRRTFGKDPFGDFDLLFGAARTDGVDATPRGAQHQRQLLETCQLLW